MSTKKLIKALGLIIVVALLAAALPQQAKAQEEPPQTLNVAEWTGPNTVTNVKGRETVLKDVDTYHMWYSSPDETKLYHTYSSDPASFTGVEECEFPAGKPIELGSVSVIKEGDFFYMVAYGPDKTSFAIYISLDKGKTWKDIGVIFSGVTVFEKIDGPFLFVEDADAFHYRLYFQAKHEDKYKIYVAESKGTKLEKPPTFELVGLPHEPVLSPGGTGTWDGGFVMQPWVVKADKTYYMWYSAHNGTDPQRIGMAKSEDGINWVKSPGNPIFLPATGFAEPSVIKDGDIWRMWTMGTGGVINYLTAKGPFEFQSIQAAIDAASTGDTIFIHAGTYVENPVLNATLNPNKQLNFIGKVDAEGNPLPVIKGTLSASGLTGKTWRIENLNFVDDVGDSISLNNGGNLTVSNCIFDGVGQNNDRAIQGSGSNQLTVENSIFQNGWYVSLQGNFTSLNVSNSTFSNVKSGINVQGVGGNTVTIESTEFSVIARGETNDTYGVRFASSGANTGGNLTITNSSFVVNKNGFVAGSGTYHSAIIIRSGATGALKVENSSILGEVVNQATSNTLDASPNWWGSVAGAGASQINGAVDFTPWCTDAACVNTAPDASGNVNLSGNVSVPGGILINEPGITYHLAADTVIKNSSPCFVVNADYVTIDAELGAKCIPTNGSDGIVVKAGVEGLRIVGIEITGKDSSIPNNTSGDGIHFNGDITDFQIVDNYIHDLDGSAIEFGGTPGGNTMHIQGNLFQNLGAAAIVVPTGLHPDLNAEFNSWGDYAGATLTDVDTEPYTHADFYMEYEGIIPLEKVAVGNTITYTVYGNLQNISGVDFTLKFPTAYLDATTLTNKSAFTAVPNGPDMFIVDEAAGTIRFRGAASTAPISGKKLPILEVVFTGTAAGTGAISFDQTNDVFAMSPGYGPSTWVYAAGYVDRTVEVFVDSAAPTLESWTPAEGDIYLAEGEDFVLTVDALDDNLFSLEIDHNVTGLPEFTVYALASNVYGSPEAAAQFAAAGVTVTYDETTQTWVLTFDSAGSALQALLAKKDVEFYAVLHDQAGKTWGSMYDVTPDNTFAYTIVFDNTAPVLESWAPAKDMTYMLTPSDDFVLTVNALDDNLFSLEIDHSLEDDLPEFSVYADETDPYGGDGQLFEEAGLEVTYNSSTQTWVLTFKNGGVALDAIIENQGVTFYAVIHDLAGNKWGSMYDVTAENTFAYTLYQQQPIARADSTGGDNVVAVVTADGNTINFTGEVAWYPADPLLGRTSGHRISVRLSAPELDFDTTDASFTFNGQTYDWTEVQDGDDYVLVYPKVTAETQSWEIVVTWGGDFSQTFTVNFNGTLGPVTAYTVDGEISMQGRVARDTEDVIKLTGYGTDIFTADSLDKLGINYTLANVLTGEYTITTHQPRYLNITTDLAKKINLISNRTLPPLELKAGNVKDTPEDANVINLNDASMIGTAYDATGNNDADANFDLRVNIQDLALVGGNFDLTSATAYASWSPVTLP